MKRPFAKKTDSIENPWSGFLVRKFKTLQEESEEMSKQARKIKQILKSSEDVEDLQKLKQAAIKLFDGNTSLLDSICSIVNVITTISVCLDKYDVVKPKLDAEMQNGKSIGEQYKSRTNL